MLWKDLREYLAKLEELGELRTVKGASWQEEIGGITELVTERKGPTVLFDNIPDYPAGYRVVSNIFTNAYRTAIALGLNPEPRATLARRWIDILRDLKPVPPEDVSSGPILENVMVDDDVDLFRFPTPKWHEKDGGRYIGTGVCVIQEDPDTGVVNVGAYRISVYDRKTCTAFIEHGKHGDQIRRKFWDRGEPAPVLISVGQEPLLTALSGPSVYMSPRGVSELDVAGYLQGSPYEVVRGRFTGLPMPASAEIVIEGFMAPPPEGLVPEGPFGEWTGYYAHGRRPETRVDVKAVYYRNDPIILGLPPQRPVGCYYNPNLGDDDIACMIDLEKAGIEGVNRVYILGRPNLRVVSITQKHPGHIDEIMRVLEPGGDQYNGHHIWILVDDDIDPSNEQEVIWALASRCAPEIGVQVVPGTAVWQLDPRIPPAGRSEPGEDGRSTYTAHNLILNACRPYEWFADFPPVAVNSQALRNRIEQRWGSVLQ